MKFNIKIMVCLLDSQIISGKVEIIFFYDVICKILFGQNDHKLLIFLHKIYFGQMCRKTSEMEDINSHYQFLCFMGITRFSFLQHFFKF